MRRLVILLAILLFVAHPAAALEVTKAKVTLNPAKPDVVKVSGSLGALVLENIESFAVAVDGVVYEVPVDRLLRKNSPYRRTEFERRRSVMVRGCPVQIVSPEDLVLSKLVWAKPSHSEVELRDVRNLVACVEAMDWEYLDRWAAVLDVQTLLAEVRR